MSNCSLSEQFDRCQDTREWQFILCAPRTLLRSCGRRFVLEHLKNDVSFLGIWEQQFSKCSWTLRRSRHRIPFEFYGL